jgi:predicted  nucleic acid-binding Zn-ribbon protein
MKNAVADTTKNGRNVMKGTCVNCGTNMMKFVSGTANKSKKTRRTAKKSKKTRGTRKRKTVSRK